MQEFHREASEALLQAGLLRLYGVRLNQKWIAVAYAFSSGGRTFYYLGDSDPLYSKLSPGTLAIGHAIEEAIREECREFDFLRGRESYKYLWGARGKLNCRRRLRLAESDCRVPA